MIRVVLVGFAVICSLGFMSQTANATSDTALTMTIKPMDCSIQVTDDGMAQQVIATPAECLRSKEVRQAVQELQRTLDTFGASGSW